jgi:hypothetical protein
VLGLVLACPKAHEGTTLLSSSPFLHDGASHRLAYTPRWLSTGPIVHLIRLQSIMSQFAAVD